MSDYFLERLYRPDGVFGWLHLGDQIIHTVERPWKNNEPFVSCIPEGSYFCEPARYNKGGYDAIAITNVPGRTHILFHKANFPDELAGCIAPNADIIFNNGMGHGRNSRQAFNLLMNAVNNQSFWLEISGINTPLGMRNNNHPSLGKN